MDKLTEADIALLRRAMDDLKGAQLTFSFVQKHLADVYRIDAGDRVDAATGAIHRAAVDKPGQPD